MKQVARKATLAGADRADTIELFQLNTADTTPFVLHRCGLREGVMPTFLSGKLRHQDIRC
jgi:hypothetical protein